MTLVKTIGFLMIFTAFVVYYIVQDRQRRRKRRKEHLERMNRIEFKHSKCVFRVLQEDIQSWRCEINKPVKKNVNLTCKDPSIADVFISVIKGGEKA